MREFRVAICDDEEIYIDQVCQYVAAYESESGNHLQIERYSSARVLVEALQSGEAAYDMLFLDVDMPDMQGTDAALAIREFDHDTVICFITSYENYAYQAFRVDAVGYLVKPVKYAEFKRMADRCIVQIQYTRDRQAAEERYFRIQTSRSETIVPTESILFIEKKRNTCVFHLEDREVTCYDTLSKVYERLNPEMFYYTHQGYIVNFDHIEEVASDRIYVEGGLEIPVSRRYYKTLHEMHMCKVKRLLAERRMAAAVAK